jgi:hypothetical protein
MFDFSAREVEALLTQNYQNNDDAPGEDLAPHLCTLKTWSGQGVVDDAYRSAAPCTRQDRARRGAVESGRASYSGAPRGASRYQANCSLVASSLPSRRQ